jgi:hypothetical protein
VVALAALTAMLLPAGPAAAAVPSGVGWSASWRYYDPIAFEVRLDIPGGRIIGYGSDVGGVRQFGASVVDTNPTDRVCVRMRVISTDEGSMGSATTCSEEYETVNTTEFTEALFVHIDLLVGGVIAKSFFTFVPSSATDASLRTVGTGTSWSYSAAEFYHAELRRPGVQVIGDGAHQGGDARMYSASVSHYDTNAGCVAGAAADATIMVGNWTCQAGASPAFSSFNFEGYIKVTGCHYPPAGAARCLTMHVPEPQ